jgi:apolipoprotein N-acyltransferase
MTAKTLHVYQSNGSWAVKKEGEQAKAFDTKKDAVAKAVKLVRARHSGQVVIHGRDGRIVSHFTYRLPRVHQPPKKSSIGDRKIEKAVHEVVLERLKSDSYPHRAYEPAK